MSIRSPKARNGLAVLKDFQKHQCSRLAAPRRNSLGKIEEEELFKRDPSSESLFKPVHHNFLRKSSSKVLGIPGRLTREPSIESLNDRGSSVYKASSLGGRRRASEFAAVNRSDLNSKKDYLRSLNY